VLSRPRASGAVQVRYTCARLASRLPDPRAARTPTTMAKITSGFPFVLLQERPANLQPCQLEPHCCDSALPAPAAVVTSEQCKERGADAWIGECTARLGGVALDPSLLVGHWLLSAVYGQRRRRDAPCAPPLFLPMIGHLPDSPDPAPKETGPADRPWCAGLRGLLAARVHGSAHPRPLTGTDPGSGKVECRRLGGSAADQPYGVVHAQADGGGCRFRSASWSPSPGRGRRSRVCSGDHSGLMGPEPPTPSSPGRSDQDRTVPATPADRRSPC
jgi:hypothetical protein